MREGYLEPSHEADAVEGTRGKGWKDERIEEVFKGSLVLADPDIRYCVLASLDERFDAHLAQAENLQALFVALNDQVFEIRELAICTVGRLSSMNPAFVMPFLRKMLIQVTMCGQSWRRWERTFLMTAVGRKRM